MKGPHPAASYCLLAMMMVLAFTQTSAESLTPEDDEAIVDILAGYGVDARQYIDISRQANSTAADAVCAPSPVPDLEI